MILKNTNLPAFFREIEEKIIICFGAGIMFGDFMRECEAYNVAEKVEFIVDNNEKLWKESRRVGDRTIFIKPVATLKNLDCSQYVVVLLGQRFQEMTAQLDEMDELADMDVYIYTFMQHITVEDKKLPDMSNEQIKIPKVIHYCWFGENELPESAKECIASWQKYCPDYKIIQWDETNYDVTKHPYMKQAYDNKAYAFVSDYARLDIIYQHGGIYLDTDVKLLKNLDDLLYHRAYCGFVHHGTRINTGIGFGAEKNFPIVGEWLDAYKYIRYEKDDYTYNITLCTEYQTNVLKFHEGFVPNGKLQIVDGLVCYPKDYFDPLSCVLGTEQRTENTYSVHYNGLSWNDNREDSLKTVRERSKASVKKLLQRIENGGRKEE